MKSIAEQLNTRCAELSSRLQQSLARFEGRMFDYFYVMFL